MEYPEFQAEKENAKPASGHNSLHNITTAIAISAATLISGCTASDPGKMKQLEAQVAELGNQLEHCQEKMPDLSKDEAVLSFGTFGVRWLFLNKENRLVASKDLEIVEQNFLIWPPVTDAAEITVEGNANNFSAAKVGSHFEVIYKSSDNVPKESLVIEVRKNVM